MTHLTRAQIANVLNDLLHGRGSTRFTGHQAQKACLGRYPHEQLVRLSSIPMTHDVGTSKFPYSSTGTSILHLPGRFNRP